MEVVTVIEGVRGNPCALHDGHSYRCKRRNKMTIYWECLKQKSQKCPGTMTTDLKYSFIKINNEHQCVPNIASNEVKVCMANAKKRAREDTDKTPMSKIYKTEFSPLFSRGLDLVSEVPNYSSIKSTLNRHRHNSQGTRTDPHQARDLILTKDLLKLNDSSNFLLMDYGSEERLLAFSTPKGQEMLAMAENVFVERSKVAVSSSSKFFQFMLIWQKQTQKLR